MRQIALDTETTGLQPQDGHRVIEIGCVEMIDRRLTGNTFHFYINPEREIDSGAIAVHGITSEFLRDKPKFEEIVSDFLTFISGAELIIHNAPFDVGFLDHELKLAGHGKRIRAICEVFDTLPLARQLHPGQKNSLDALCRRYNVDNAHRNLHGALLDSELLAQVYLVMTGGQSSFFEEAAVSENNDVQNILNAMHATFKTPIISVTDEEKQAHEEFLKLLSEKSGAAVVWEE